MAVFPSKQRPTRWLRVTESWGLRANVSTPTGFDSWERKGINLTAYDRYEVYLLTLPQEQRGEWTAGVYIDLEDEEFERLLKTMHRVPDHRIYPVFEPDLTQFDPEASDQDYFLKQPNSPETAGEEGDDNVAKMGLAEARTHQRFLAHPHANLGTYLGCVVHGGRIVGLAFPRYVQDLMARVDEARAQPPTCFPPEAQSACMDSIESAVRHLHSMGYGHNDISAPNIMFDGDGNAILIDLDSCTPLGEKIIKGGVVGGWRGPGFSKHEFTHSSIECDEVSLQYIRDWLAGELCRRE